MKKISAERAHLKRRQYRRVKVMPPTLPLTTADYMANCVHHILAAECSPGNSRQRERDIVQAVTVAAARGVKAAHAYLITLAKSAGEGQYAPQSVDPPAAGAAREEG